MKNVKQTTIALSIILAMSIFQSCENSQVEEIEAEIENSLYTEGGNDTGSEPSENTP